jgi:hypothetical protein
MSLCAVNGDKDDMIRFFLFSIDFDQAIKTANTHYGW